MIITFSPRGEGYFGIKTVFAERSLVKPFVLAWDGREKIWDVEMSKLDKALSVRGIRVDKKFAHKYLMDNELYTSGNLCVIDYEKPKPTVIEEDITKCPYCGSTRIFSLRIDSDWSYGTGSYETVNEDRHYTKEELKYNATNRPDINVLHCRHCDKIFEQ